MTNADLLADGVNLMLLGMFVVFSLLATRMRIDDMLPIAPQLDQVGFWSLEVRGGATFDACIRYLGEVPWERLRRLKRANKVGLEADHHNFLLMRAIVTNVAGVIGSAVAAGILLAIVGGG